MLGRASLIVEQNVFKFSVPILGLAYHINVAAVAGSPTLTHRTEEEEQQTSNQDREQIKEKKR